MSDPIRLVVTDDLQRSRLTVFFRYLLAIPHFVWLFLWGVVVLLAAIANWVATLIRGTSPQPLHNFIARYVRYEIHVAAYVYLLANRFPGFLGNDGYEVDVTIPPPARQNRWTVLFRLFLASPAFLIAGQLGGGGARSAGGLLLTAGILGWFAAMVRGAMPRGLRDAGTYGLAYGAQVVGYLLLLTGRYPNSDPQAALDDLPVRDDPVRLTVVDDDLRRSRLTVFFRYLLAIPHLVWLYLWGVIVVVAWIVNWFATLIMGRSPAPLHRFLSAYLRYQTHVSAYVMLTANPFPGFTGNPGIYPVELTIAPPERQGRWKVFFRLLLAFPALFISSAYSGLMLVCAILGWFSSMVRGRMPVGLRNAQALALRYQQQLNAYVYLLTASYPYSGPTAAPAAFEPPVPQPPSPLAQPA